MKQLLVLLLSVSVIILFTGCKKDQQQFDESMFTGTWVKGTSAGDTLQFGKKNDLNLLSYNISFNAALPVVAQLEYSYENGKLAVKKFVPADKSFYAIPSFKWVVEGEEFEIRGIDLFNFISSTQSVFVYKKVN